jgi:hypothetical protein
MATSQGTLPALLDELQAAEEAGAEALGVWIARCGDPRLRGGLRVIRARDLAHARLARRRLAALGGTSGHATPRQVQNLCGVLTAPDVSNRSKLAILLSRFPARPDDRLPETVRALDDAETRALLETVHDDDRASLRWLREMGETIGDDPAVEPGPTPAPTLAFLDALRAAEAASAEVFGAWRIACTLAGLRGGLETIAEREATHAALLAERVEELGGVVQARVDDAVVAAARDRFGSPELSDDDKLARVTARYADDEAVVAPIEASLATLGDDGETYELLRLLLAGESATFAWLRAYHRAVAERPREVSLRVLDGGR